MEVSEEACREGFAAKLESWELKKEMRDMKWKIEESKTYMEDLKKENLKLKQINEVAAAALADGKGSAKKRC